MRRSAGTPARRSTFELVSPRLEWCDVTGVVTATASESPEHPGRPPRRDHEEQQPRFQPFRGVQPRLVERLWQPDLRRWRARPTPATARPPAQPAGRRRPDDGRLGRPEDRHLDRPRLRDRLRHLVVDRRHHRRQHRQPGRLRPRADAGDGRRRWRVPAVAGQLLQEGHQPGAGLAFAAVEGVALGAISKVFDAQFGDGIVTQAVLGTFAAFAGTLAAYKFFDIKVGNKFRTFVIAGMFGMVGLGLLSMVLSFFGINTGLYGFGTSASCSPSPASCSVSSC